MKRLWWMQKWPADSCPSGPRWSRVMKYWLFSLQFEHKVIFLSLWLQGHVCKAQALVSFGRTEEALREYLICLSIEPDCRLAKTEAHKVLVVFSLFLIKYFMSLQLHTIVIIRVPPSLFVSFPQLLSEILAPVTDQVPGPISDHSNILSSRAHIKSSLSSPVQVQ